MKFKRITNLKITILSFDSPSLIETNRAGTNWIHRVPLKRSLWFSFVKKIKKNHYHNNSRTHRYQNSYILAQFRVRHLSKETLAWHKATSYNLIAVIKNKKHSEVEWVGVCILVAHSAIKCEWCSWFIPECLLGTSREINGLMWHVGNSIQATVPASPYAVRIIKSLII